MRTHDLVPIAALVLPLALAGCAELAAVAPSLSIDALAVHRGGASGERWSWGVGGRLGGTLDARPIGVAHEVRARIAAPPPPSSRCRIAEICAWEARARARAIERLRTLAGASEEGSP